MWTLAVNSTSLTVYNTATLLFRILTVTLLYCVCKLLTKRTTTQHCVHSAFVARLLIARWRHAQPMARRRRSNKPTNGEDNRFFYNTDTRSSQSVSASGASLRKLRKGDSSVPDNRLVCCFCDENESHFSEPTTATICDEIVLITVCERAWRATTRRRGANYVV